MARRFAFLDNPGPLAFAHRGGAAEGHENTMSAFERAVRLGYRYLETDVHATSDGVLLAFHDRTLDRMTDRTGAIAALPYDEVAKARIGGAEPIPLLEDLLGTWPEVRVNIDVKDYPAVAPLMRVLGRVRAHDRVCITSFSGRRLARARAALGPAVCTSLGPGEVADLRMASYTSGYGRRLARVLRLGAGCVQVPIRAGAVPIVTPAFLRTAHALGLQVHVWTVDDPRLIERVLDMGADGIMTDNISGLRDVLVARGAWSSGAPSADFCP